MTVMDIAHMRMGMPGWCMAVFMGVPVGAISVDSFQLLKTVIVFVMGITSTWVVAMSVGVVQGFMLMPVAVLLSKQENNTCSHESGC